MINIDWTEDWEEEDPDEDIIIPYNKLKVGDKVRVVNISTNWLYCKEYCGYIKAINRSGRMFMVGGNVFTFDFNKVIDDNN